MPELNCVSDGDKKCMWRSAREGGEGVSGSEWDVAWPRAPMSAAAVNTKVSDNLSSCLKMMMCVTRSSVYGCDVCTETPFGPLRLASYPRFCTERTTNVPMLRIFDFSDAEMSFARA
jgi:hypothetical protein